MSVLSVRLLQKSRGQLRAPLLTLPSEKHTERLADDCGETIQLNSIPLEFTHNVLRKQCFSARPRDYFNDIRERGS